MRRVALPPYCHLKGACLVLTGGGCCRAAEKAAAAEEKRKHKKNLKVLSFGDDVEEDEGEDLAPRAQMRSAHDAIMDPRWGTFGLMSVPQRSTPFLLQAPSLLQFQVLCGGTDRQVA